MDNLFDFITPNMFNVLSSVDNKVNFDLLLKIFDMEENFSEDSIFYDDILDSFTTYFHSLKIKELDDEEGNDISKRSSRDKASAKIRQFRKTGWLEEGNSDLFKIKIGLTSNGKAFLRFFKDFIAEQTKPLAYTGYIFTVWSVLNNFDFSQGANLVQHIYSQTQRLISDLSRLASQIKNYFNDLIESQTMDSKAVLDTLLFKYQKQYIYRNFNNLLTLDNPTKYTTDILEVLNDLLYKNFDRLLENYIKVNGIDNTDSESLAIIEDEIKRQLQYMIIQYDNIFEKVKEIDEANSRLVASVQAKLDFLLNVNLDVSGQIKEALKLLSSKDEDFELGEFFNLYSCSNIDFKSLYAPRFNKEKKVMIEQKVFEGDKEDIEKGMNDIFNDDPLSLDNIDASVVELLTKSPQISSKDIEINSQQDLVKLMLIQLYSSNPDVSYSSNFSSVEYEANEHRVLEFSLKKKGEANL
ncbi:MAG: DUF5716 family protein [Bacilli bacterium]|nr:DUF5716 family protein [Bacilli bacterium]MDY6430345.1 DUF5716 family protein [Bacilli bacterium]